MIKFENAVEFEMSGCINVDITAPLYWWDEFDTCQIGSIINLYNTIHSIKNKEFSLDDFSHEYLTEANVRLLKDTIYILNFWRSKLVSDELPNMLLNMTESDIRYQIVQLLPSSYNQKRTVMLTNEDLVDICKNCKDFELAEWLTLCNWIEQLLDEVELKRPEETEQNP